jgi:superfamily II DNA helicase RecQ
VPSDTAPDAVRLARLKAWRIEEARKQAVPAYVILHDATLAEIARRQPPDQDALAEIPGIGQKKLERYGSALIALVRD